MSKTKPQQHILDKSGSLLRHVTHSEFKELLLPTLQKTMLRSPENAMRTVSFLLSAVTLDLSQYAMDIGKAIASQLKANNAQLMEEAVKAMQNLTQQCSDATAVQDIVTHLFKILGGSEGKLTIVAQKISVLSVVQLSRPRLEQMLFSFHLVHEGTLVHAVSVLSQWSSRLTVEVPATLLDWFKKAYNLKTSTSAVRHAYLQTMLQVFRVLQLCERLFLDHAHRLNTSKSHAVVSELECEEEGTADCQEAALLSGWIQSRSRPSRRTTGRLLVISMLSNVQVLPQDVLVSESGELTELGRSYTPPRVLLDALCVVCSAASQWGDPTEAENMAMETLIVTHHPSIGTGINCT
ncbi:hypothetical protein GOODEAATRI_011466 [Goodea atripinnis]|uniref:Stalled ribosome sensor GCN1-like N-terminal domain-containing protein n=1 Tax=Goodea atripinnis TaxID=208336 RepID=A0ABV0NX71_9TELE